MTSKGTIVAAVVVVALLLGVGAWALTSSGPKDSAVTMNDAMGRNVSIEVRPERVISCSPGITEMVYAFGVGSKLVGVTTYCDYPTDVLDREAAGTLDTIGGYYFGIDTEKIIALNPDVVFLEKGVTEQVNMIPKLEQAGIKAVAFYEGGNSTLVKGNIGLMGQALHEVAKANSLVDTMNAKFDSIELIVGEPEHRPKVMMVIWWDSTSIWVGGTDTFIDELITKAGGENAFGNLEGWSKVNREDIIVAQPDMIILAGMAMGNVDEAMSNLKNDTLLNTMPVVQNDDITVILGQAENTLLRQSVRMVEGAYLISMMLYPEKFTKELPKNVADDYKQYLPGTW
jgi:iron complex transport system substrate-binding protein